MELTECSETSAHKIHTPENHPEERTQHSEHGESFKSRSLMIFSEDKQNCISNIRLLILFHFMSAINFSDLYRQTLVNCRAYPDWDLGISFFFFFFFAPCNLGVTVLILAILRFSIFSYVGSKFSSPSCSERPAVRVRSWRETNAGRC